jgi:hypothetical protein
MAAAHGRTSHRTPDAWFCGERMPPFYPNAISLHAAAAAADILAALPAAMPAGWGFKDSFRTLTLGSHGFAPLFDADWIAREPGERWPDAPGPVRTVEDDAGLGRWAAAWGESGEPVFVPALLDDRRVTFLAVEADGAIVAGLAAMRSAGVVGFSNAFGPPELVAACLRALDDAATPIVGYETPEDAAALAPLGFRTTGGLRIWALE